MTAAALIALAGIVTLLIYATIQEAKEYPEDYEEQEFLDED